MPTTKIAADPAAFRRTHLPFASARSAFKAFLRAVDLRPDERVLLPSYVGWSPREGSGVFDPVRELGLGHDFYRLDDRLGIDLDDLEARLGRGGTKIVVLIHYFGRPDAAYPEAVALAQRSGALVLEDEAHAMLSDLVGGVCGRLGEACIFSLHKLLPLGSGGALVLNARALDLAGSVVPGRCDLAAWDYDLAAIARRRVSNAGMLRERLAYACPALEPLWGDWPEGVVPQTLPVLVRGMNRDVLYERLNAAGVGAVSLYHTLIREIGSEAFPDAHRLSRQILNLPVHQDVRPDEIEGLVERIAACVAALRGAPAP